MGMWELVAREQIRDTLARYNLSAVVPRNRLGIIWAISRVIGSAVLIQTRRLASTTSLPLELFPPEALTFLHQHTMQPS